MRESRTSGSVRGGRGNPVPYRYKAAAWFARETNAIPAKGSGS